MNERWCEVFGYARDEASGARLTDLGVWGDDDRRQALLDRVLRGDLDEVVVRLRRRDGRGVEVRSSAALLTLDGDRCLVCQGVEVTDRARADAFAEVDVERADRSPATRGAIGARA